VADFDVKNSLFFFKNLKKQGSKPCGDLKKGAGRPFF
jgi:hypothetical protein